MKIRALQRLTPPLLQMRLVADGRSCLTEGNVEFRIGPGPLALCWLTRHGAGPAARSFSDRMIDGPFASREHQHVLEPLAQSVTLTDRISLAHHSGWCGLLTRLLFDGPALQLLYMCRLWRMRRALIHRSAPEAGWRLYGHFAAVCARPTPWPAQLESGRRPCLSQRVNCRRGGRRFASHAMSCDSCRKATVWILDSNQAKA